jgi:nucleoside triphosphate pyrophosphatase
MSLILASESRRRLELLLQCGIECEVKPAGIAEDGREGEAPEDVALRLCREKARAAAVHLEDREAWVLAADTVVADGPDILGKPADRGQARAFLQRLRGREHRVITGVCLFHAPSGRERSELSETRVRMREYSPEELERYLESGDPMDKAGAYAIQHPDFKPVAALDGCYTNVVGLPLCKVYWLLENAGWSPEQPLPESCRAGGECGFLPAGIKRYENGIRR